MKRLVRRAKLANPESYGGYSLRAGFVTEASGNGATDRQIMKQTGHKSIAMVHPVTIQALALCLDVTEEEVDTALKEFEADLLGAARRV